MNDRLKHIIISLFLLLIFSAIGSSVKAQFYFGKNKVQYTDFDWQVMTTEHFKIYFYEEENEVAAVAAKSAEDSYRFLAQRFNLEIKRKIPLIIYSSPGYFTQTNIIPGILPESVAGFTEFMKGRVVVPFHGSYYDFNHVIRHEMVHVFTLAKLDAVTERRTKMNFPYPPLWFIEGLAEYYSTDWNSEADMIVKDMVLNERLFSINQLYAINGTYFMYKLGESICHFIDSTYGPDKLVKIFENWHKGKTFDHIVKITLGDNLFELSKKWEYSLKKKYYPEIATSGLPDMESTRMTHDGYNVKAVPIKWDFGDGEREWIVYKANRLGYSGIYMRPLGKHHKPVKTLVKGNRSSDFESLYLLRSGIDVHPSGLIVFSSKSKETDVIYIYDLREGKVTERYEFKDLVATRSPRFSSNGLKVAFSGVKKSGFSDIYQLDLISGNYKNLTGDIYYDVDPVYSTDGSEIVFSSDRAAVGAKGALNLYSLNLESNEIESITSGFYRDQTPEYTDAGIYFSSNRDGAYNIYLLDNEGNLTRQSTYATGAFDPRISADGKKLTYSGYQKMGFHLYTMDLPEEPQPVAYSASGQFGSWKPKLIPGKYRKASIKYDTDYSFDIAQSMIGYNPVYGSIGGFQAALSDVLGNHMYYLLLTNTARTRDDILESFNFGITYINRSKRINWGLGFFHLFDEYYNDREGYFFERQAGGLSLVSYPFSKFHRIDFTTLVRYTKKDHRFGFNRWEKVLASNYVSWIYDNSLWDFTGPIDGRRYNVTFGITSSLSDMSNWNRSFSADLRHYFRLGKYSAFANRLFVYRSSGFYPQRIYFGGSWSLRGYERRSFYAKNILFASNELRFPLIDNLLIGFPFARLGFRGIRGALFFDVASVWENEFDQFIGAFGAGMRVSLGYIIVLRFDFTRTTDFKTISPTTDFDFFFGWNF